MYCIKERPYEGISDNDITYNVVWYMYVKQLHSADQTYPRKGHGDTSFIGIHCMLHCTFPRSPAYIFTCMILLYVHVVQIHVEQAHFFKLSHGSCGL